MNRSLVLATLIAFSFVLPETHAQTSDNQSAGLIKSRSATPAKPAFTMPPSYLETLRSQTAPRSLYSLSRLNAVDRPATSAAIEERPARPDSQRRTFYGSAPPAVHPYQALSPTSTGQVAKTPVLQGFTTKNGKVKLRGLSANTPGGLNNKWLELQERELIE